MADGENINQYMVRSQFGRTGRSVIAVIVFLLAIVAGYAAWRFQSFVQTWMIVSAAALSVIGALSLIAWLAGAFSLTGGDPERHFYDAMTDALVDCCVVTDAKGRAVYANAHYLKLASRAGVGRLVGFDVLYSGYNEFAEPIYQLAQAAREGKVLQRDVRVGAGSSAPGSAQEQARWLRVAISHSTRIVKAGKHFGD